MTPISQITAMIADRLRQIDGIGKVYNMLGDAVTDADFKNRFVNGSAINAWEVTREGSQGVDVEAQAMKRTQMIVIYGYYSYKDGASDPIIQQLVDNICAAFDPYSVRRFDGSFDYSGPLQVEGPRLGTKGAYLIHFVRMTYPVELYPIS